MIRNSKCNRLYKPKFLYIESFAFTIYYHCTPDDDLISRKYIGVSFHPLNELGIASMFGTLLEIPIRKSSSESNRVRDFVLKSRIHTSRSMRNESKY
jgi:hypothetical protein